MRAQVFGVGPGAVERIGEERGEGRSEAVGARRDELRGPAVPAEVEAGGPDRGDVLGGAEGGGEQEQLGVEAVVGGEPVGAALVDPAQLAGDDEADVDTAAQGVAVPGQRLDSGPVVGLGALARSCRARPATGARPWLQPLVPVIQRTPVTVTPECTAYQPGAI
ncbi:hypothetical protein ACFV7Q_31840 [Streptomyces sp. NPDC059851]|uniref:hypothetical protein n=1 Tax=Streptomyces sp. NPDC059851 TaxID=3346971 RepID=UPI003651CEE3